MSRQIDQQIKSDGEMLAMVMEIQLLLLGTKDQKARLISAIQKCTLPGTFLV